MPSTTDSNSRLSQSETLRQLICKAPQCNALGSAASLCTSYVSCEYVVWEIWRAEANLLNEQSRHRQRTRIALKVHAPPGAPPLVILPGFGNMKGDYTEPFGDKDKSICTALQSRGFQTSVVEVRL
jgi:hypothetical protein